MVTSQDKGSAKKEELVQQAKSGQSANGSVSKQDAGATEFTEKTQGQDGGQPIHGPTKKNN